MIIEDPEIMNYIEHVEQIYFITGMFCGITVAALIIFTIIAVYITKKMDAKEDK